jgi:hypothetical protein
LSIESEIRPLRRTVLHRSSLSTSSIHVVTSLLCKSVHMSVQQLTKDRIEPVKNRS